MILSWLEVNVAPQRCPLRAARSMHGDFLALGTPFGRKRSPLRKPSIVGTHRNNAGRNRRGINHLEITIATTANSRQLNLDTATPFKGDQNLRKALLDFPV